MALRAYFDASEQGGVFSVAGFAFGVSNAGKAQSQWKRLHGDRPLHMTDLHNRKNDFDGWSNGDAGDLLKQSVAIITKHMKFGVAASCHVSDVNAAPQMPTTGDRLTDTLAKGFGSPYAWCCHIAMYTLGSLVRRAGGGLESVNYVLETGDAGQGKVKEFVRFVEDYPAPLLRDAYCMNNAVFATKKGNEVLLQTGDIFSWEWARRTNMKREGLPVRKSLEAIFGGFDEAPQKFGVTAYSKVEGRAMASHYEGDSWRDGYRELCENFADNEVNPLVSHYRRWSEVA
ncbi:MAG: hypothetical protein KDK24_00125 [Pseudooceanicola sp.]|nr:hypothetical protein [Pseudooceanicola sp.]